jgi:Winged helix DNA-binding domain
VREPADVARAICGAQAQDANAGRLALRARSARFTGADVERARTEERSLVRAWAMRGTMHLLAAEDAGWLLPLFEPSVAENSSRRLVQLGVEPAAQERALREIERSLQGGPVTRGELALRIERRGLTLDPARRLHLFRLAVARNIACIGPGGGSGSSLALARDWFGERPAHERDAALAELARRYVGAFGPATEPDFALWSGLPLRDLRAGLAAVARELTETRVDGRPAWTLGSSPRPRARIVRLLPAWDTYLMGYRDRSFMAAPTDWNRIQTGGGILRPTVVVDGAAVGLWRLARDAGTLRVELEPFGELEGAVRRAVEDEVADIGRFEGMPATTVVSP